MSGHLDGPPPGPPDPPYIPGDLGAPSAEEFARRRASPTPEERNPYAPSADWKPGQDTFTSQAAGIWAEGFAAGRAADPNTEGVWPDQSAMHGVLLDQIKDAYAEGIADTIDRLRVRAAEMLPEVARFTLDEIEVAAADLLASSTAEKLAEPEPHESERIAEWAAREAEPNPYRSQDQIVRDEERQRIVKVLRERATSPRSKDHGWSALEEAADFIERGDTDA